MTTKDNGLPSFIRSWGVFYALLVGWLVFLIAFLYFFTVYFR